MAQNAALAECQTLLQEAAQGWEATAAAAEAASAAAVRQAGQEYMHAATRHLYYQRALLQLLLRQLTFCVSELQSKFICLAVCCDGSRMEVHASAASEVQSSLWRLLFLL